MTTTRTGEWTARARIRALTREWTRLAKAALTRELEPSEDERMVKISRAIAGFSKFLAQVRQGQEEVQT